MTSEIGLMLAERIFRALYSFARCSIGIGNARFRQQHQHAVVTPATANEMEKKKKTPNPTTLHRKHLQFRRKMPSNQRIHNKWKGENFLCIYFRTWCVCFCSIYFSYSHFLYYRFLPDFFLSLSYSITLPESLSLFRLAILYRVVARRENANTYTHIANGYLLG